MGHSAQGLGGACHFNSLSVVEKAKVSQWKNIWKTSTNRSMQSRVTDSVSEVNGEEVNFAVRNKSFTERK